jgi:hypothetical protein
MAYRKRNDPSGFRECTQCKAFLSLENFYLKGKYYMSCCKVCWSDSVKAFCKTDRGRIMRRHIARRYRSKSCPKKLRARNQVSAAIYLGKLKRLPCEICGALAEAHHPNYNKPLEIRWLCLVHHRAEHV